MLSKQIVEVGIRIRGLILAKPPEPVAALGRVEGVEGSQAALWSRLDLIEPVTGFSQQVPGKIFLSLANPGAEIVPVA